MSTKAESLEVIIAEMHAVAPYVALQFEDKLRAAFADRLDAVAVSDAERLRAFVLDLFDVMDWPEGGDLDAIDFQELATKHGLLNPTEMTEACGDNCFCIGVDEPPFTCYRKTELLTGRAIASAKTK